MKRVVFIAYDLEHVHTAAKQAEAGGEVLAINFWVEQALKKRGVAYRSYVEYADPNQDDGPLLAKAQVAAREWYRVPEMHFFKHNGVPLGEALESALAIYLARLAHFRAMFEQILDAEPTLHLIVPYPTLRASAVTGPLTHFEMSAVVDAARAAALVRNLPFDTVGESPSAPKQHVRPGSRRHALLVTLYNTLIRFVPRRKLKIYATEYWHHIAPFIERMTDVELVLMERSEFKHIPWLQAWKHRIQLVHPRDVASTRMYTIAAQAVERFRAAWPHAQTALASHPALISVGLPLLESVLEYLVCVYAERVVIEIEALEEILRHERPDKVLERVSVSSYQTHFFVLARIARRLGIPSIEVQHAGAHIDPRSVFSHLETDYLASYGSYTRTWYERIGVEGERVLPIGSPRFDRCIVERPTARGRGEAILRKARLDPTRPTLLFAVPALETDSYILADIFCTLREVQKRISGLQVVLKFRNDQRPLEVTEFLGELFPTGLACVGTTDLFALASASTVTVCGNSTVIYEALLARTPLILYPWHVSDTYHAEMYAPAAPLLHNAKDFVNTVVHVFGDEAYRTRLVEHGQQFLEKYSFDGHSSERLIALLSAPLPVHKE